VPIGSSDIRHCQGSIKVGAMSLNEAEEASVRPEQRNRGRESLRSSKVTIGMLKPEQIARFRKELTAERRAIEGRIAARKGDIMDTVRDEEGVGDNEDEAQLTYGREDGIVSDELDAQQLEQVKKALARIDAGTYGLSEVSGKPIPLDRLEAVPSATTLVNEDSPDGRPATSLVQLQPSPTNLCTEGTTSWILNWRGSAPGWR